MSQEETVIAAHLGALAHSPGQFDIALAACVEFANLAESHRGNLACQLANVVPAVLGVLKQHGSSVASVAAACLRCLWRLDVSSSACLPRVLTALRAHYTNADIATCALAVMIQACSTTVVPHGNEEVLIELGVVEAVQQVLHAHAASAHHVAKALQLLTRLSCKTPKLACIGTVDMVRALLHATAAHVDCTDIAKYGVWLLGNIVVDNSVEHTARELGGVSVTAAVLQRHGANLAHAELCCLALHNLAYAEQRLELFVAAGCCPLLLATVSTHRHVKESSSVLQDALHTIATLAKHAELRAVFVANAAAAVVREVMAAQIAAQPLGSWSVLSAGCRALGMLEGDSTSPACACASVTLILEVLKAYGHAASLKPRMYEEQAARLAVFGSYALSRFFQHAAVAHHAMSLGCVDVVLTTVQWAVGRVLVKQVRRIVQLLVQLSDARLRRLRSDDCIEEDSDMTSCMETLCLEPDADTAVRRAALAGALVAVERLCAEYPCAADEKKGLVAAAALLRRNLQ